MTEPSQKMQPAKILVVEDNPAVREFVVRSLASAGYELQEAIDGQQALEILAREPFDILVSDIVMPHVDGIALAMKAGRLYPDLKIVMMSGYAQERMRAHNLESLVYKVVAKPFSLEEICGIVKNALSEDTTLN